MSDEFWKFARDFFSCGEPLAPPWATPHLNLRTCVKCGSNLIKVEYHGNIDKLKCECTTCSYKWEQTPLDAKGKRR